MKPLLRLATAVVSLSFAACRGGAQQASTNLVVSSDPALAKVAAQLLPDLAKRAGLELKRPVRIERRSRADLVRYLRAKLDQDMPPAVARATVQAYALLGLAPDTLNLRATLLSLYEEQVAGFYDPDSTALFVLDDQPPGELRGLLIHELVHAVQDQSVDLAALTAPGVDNDRRTAAQAAIEGQATLVMMEYMLEQREGAPVDLGAMPDFADSLRHALGSMMSQFPALASAPAVIRKDLLFPYEAGTGYVQWLWSHGKRLAPFGPYLPRSTEQVMTHDLSDAPVELELDAPAGVSVVRSNVLGRLEVGVLLDAHLGKGGDALSKGWGGDRYALVATAGGGRALVWYSVWDSVAARDRFVHALADHLSGFGAPTTLRPTTVDGRPGAVLRVGAAPAIKARVEGGSRR